jgi:hypothetical protein
LLHLNKLVEKSEVDHYGTLLKLSLSEGHLILGLESIGKYLVPFGILTLDALGADDGFLAGFSVNKFNLDESVDLLGGEDVFLVSEGAGGLLVIFGEDIFGIVVVVRKSDGDIGGSDDVEEHLTFTQAFV